MMLQPNPLTHDELSRLIGSAEANSAFGSDERRRFERFTVSIDVVCQGLSEQCKPITRTVSGAVLNVSCGGVVFDSFDEIYAPLVLVQFLQNAEVTVERIVRVSRRVPVRGAAVIAGEFVADA